MDIGSLLTKIGLSASLAQDVSLLIVVTLASFVFGMFLGRYKLITILINIYAAYAVMLNVPEKYFTEYTYKLIFFLAGVVGLTLLSRQLFEVYISGSGPRFLWRVFVMSFFEIGLMLSIVLTIIPQKIASEYISSTAFEYLATENARLAWMVLPMICLFFVSKYLNRE